MPPSVETSAAPAASSSSFCQAVARQDAGRNDFDAATRARVLARSYRQCVQLFGAL
jgi:hypothetical protein